MKGEVKGADELTAIPNLKVILEENRSFDQVLRTGSLITEGNGAPILFPNDQIGLISGELVLDLELLVVFPEMFPFRVGYKRSFYAPKAFWTVP